MNIKTIAYTREKICPMIKLNAVFKENIDVLSFHKNDLLLACESQIYSESQPEKTLYYTCPKPSFLDWLFRREKELTIAINCKDALLNPPKQPGQTIRLFYAEIKE